jgi:hypothetical protein
MSAADNATKAAQAKLRNGNRVRSCGNCAYSVSELFGPQLLRCQALDVHTRKGQVCDRWSVVRST